MNRVSTMPGVPKDYTGADLVAKYGLGREEARRILRCYGAERIELDRLLAGIGRTSTHRAQEIDIPPGRIAFGLG